MAETPDGLLARGQLLMLPPPGPASGGLSALVPRSPAASPPTHTSSPPKSPGGFALQVPRAQLHHCQQVFPKLCTKNTRRLFIRELSQDPGAAQLVKKSPLPMGACLYFHRGLYRTFSHWMKHPRQPEWLSPSDAEFSPNNHCCQGQEGV